MKRHGVDFDGTLSTYDSSVPFTPGMTGEPIPDMLDRVKHWLEIGDKVDIFTARVHPAQGEEKVTLEHKAITEWLVKHLGVSLDITCMKHWQWDDYWDDRAVRVEKNTGRVLSIVPLSNNQKSDAIGGFLMGL